jgi:hypothetical protein
MLFSRFMPEADEGVGFAGDAGVVVAFTPDMQYSCDTGSGTPFFSQHSGWEFAPLNPGLT